jgi:citrate synthase
MSGVAAAAFSDLGFTPVQGEMLHLLMRLPGAAAHALEQWQYGHRKFPFFTVELENDPAREAI